MKKRKAPSQASSPQVYNVDSPAKTPQNAASPDFLEISPPKPKNAPSPGKAASKPVTIAKPAARRTKSISGQKALGVEDRKPAPQQQPQPKVETEAQKRQKEFKDAESDPVPFLEKAWKDLSAVAPKQDGFLTASTCLSQDVSLRSLAET
jgi:hypothetical protein